MRSCVWWNCLDHASEVQVTMMLTESCKLRGLHHRWVEANTKDQSLHFPSFEDLCFFLNIKHLSNRLKEGGKTRIPHNSNVVFILEQQAIVTSHYIINLYHGYTHMLVSLSSWLFTFATLSVHNVAEKRLVYSQPNTVFHQSSSCNHLLEGSVWTLTKEHHIWGTKCVFWHKCSTLKWNLSLFWSGL